VRHIALGSKTWLEPSSLPPFQSTLPKPVEEVGVGGKMMSRKEWVGLVAYQVV